MCLRHCASFPQHHLQQPQNCQVVATNFVLPSPLTCEAEVGPVEVCLKRKSRRVRTAFNEQQQISMQAFFVHNQNPNADDLTALARETGLAKRVLQVVSPSAFRNPSLIALSLFALLSFRLKRWLIRC